MPGIDLFGHGGRKEQGLTIFGRHVGQNAPNVREKSHVEHLIGFVDHQHFQVGKINGPSIDMVQQPSGAGHHNLGPFERLELGIDPHAAVNYGAAQARPGPQDLEGAMNLFGQFAGGGQ